MTSIQPELWVENADEAVSFYQAAFGAKVLHCVGAGDDIVAQLSVGDAPFWVAPSSAQMKRLSPRAIDGATSRTLLVVEDPESVVRQAVAAGATESSPVSNEHGWLLGRIIDPFGHEWEIGFLSEHGRRPSEASGYATVAKTDNVGWSLYGAPWLQPVAINGKSTEPRNGENKPEPLPWVATSCDPDRMVRRRSPVRVRERA
jgi:PhnB protein